MKTPTTTSLQPIGYIWAVLMFTALFGCTNAPNEPAENTDSLENKLSNQPKNSEIGKRAEILSYPLPTPFEVSNMLNDAGAMFNFDLTNALENITKYETEDSKALNLGVYGADLSYAISFNMVQETGDYLDCTKKLTEDLGLASVFKKQELERIETNIENKDTLYNIVSGFYSETFEKLTENKMGNLAVLVLAGGVVESLFVSTQLATFALNDKSKLYEGIADQKQTVSTLLATMKQYTDDKGVIKAINKIQQIQDAFVDVGDTLTEEQFEKISQLVMMLRKEIV